MRIEIETKQGLSIRRPNLSAIYIDTDTGFLKLSPSFGPNNGNIAVIALDDISRIEIYHRSWFINRKPKHGKAS